MNRKNVKKGIFPYIFLLLFVVAVMFVFDLLNQKVNEFTYDEFMKYVNAGEIK